MTTLALSEIPVYRGPIAAPDPLVVPKPGQTIAVQRTGNSPVNGVVTSVDMDSAGAFRINVRAEENSLIWNTSTPTIKVTYNTTEDVCTQYVDQLTASGVIRIANRYSTDATTSSNYFSDMTPAWTTTDAADFSGFVVRTDWATWDGQSVSLSKADAERYRMRDQLRSNRKFQSKYLNIVKDATPEGKARRLLRDLVGEGAFKQYLKRGFVTVQGPSGLLYQVSPGYITSYAKTKSGKYRRCEGMCVVFKNQGLPPTDAVIMRMLLCQRDEFGLRSYANIIKYDSKEEFEVDKYGGLLDFKKPRAQAEPIRFVTGDNSFIYTQEIPAVRSA